jgi:hypothetical protein
MNPPYFATHNGIAHEIVIDSFYGSCHDFVVRITTDKETGYMATSTQISELEQCHRMLEEQIAECLQHPYTDQIKLSELKRRKLQVKDQIALLQMRAEASVH